MRSKELRRRGLSIYGLLASTDTAALADLERLLVFHIITTQPCDVVVASIEAVGIQPPHSRCWGQFDSVKFDGLAL
jgi:hypothetical protein